MNAIERRKHIKLLLAELELSGNDLAKMLGVTNQSISEQLKKDGISEKVYNKYLGALESKLKDVSIGGDYITGNEGVNIIKDNKDTDMGDTIGKQEIHGNEQVGVELVKALKEVIQEKTSTITTLSKHIESLQKRIIELDSQNLALEEKMMQYDEHVKEEEKAIKQITEQLSEVMGQLSEHTKSCEGCKTHDRWAREIKKAILKEIKDIKQQIVLGK